MDKSYLSINTGRTDLIKIQKIAAGISQLFTAMDRGFAKIETDLTLLTRFRHICFNANEKIDRSLAKISHFTLIDSRKVTSHTPISETNCNETVVNELINIKETIAASIVIISDYIEEYADLWEKSFSLSALLKFKLLLVNEFNLLNKEIEMLGMQELNDKRQQILKKSENEKVG